MMQTTDLVHDYLAAWNETDLALRRAAVQRLYAANGRIVTASVDAHGIEDVLGHVDRVVAGFIGREYRFRQAGVAMHHDCVLLRWEMITADSAQVADWGVNTLVLDADGRVVADYQFVAPAWAA
ncbi:MAG: nuclear transport factor 2 family protein [Acidimicrobiales bacterium]